METTSPSASAVSRAEGFLAGLVYLNSTLTAIDQSPDPFLLNPQTSNLWAPLQYAQTKLEETRLRLVNATRSMRLAGLDSTLDSLETPMAFYEAAIGGFRDTLLGLPPTTLGGVVGLCSLSRIALIEADYETSIDLFSNFVLWRDAINNHKHRRAFSDLIKAVFLEPPLAGQAFFQPITLMGANPTLQSPYQDARFIAPVPQRDGNNMFWNCYHAMHGLPTTHHPSAARPNEHHSYPIICSIQSTRTQSPNLQSLQGSSIVANFTHFLEQCGEVPLLLSTGGAKADGRQPIYIYDLTRTETESHIVNSYIRVLQNNNSLRTPTSERILSIAYRFVDLGYLQNAKEIRDYLLLIAKVCLSSLYGLETQSN